jgi:DNA-binding Xre family transcriptional regulator
MRTSSRKTTNSRARRRARCHKPKAKREKVAALVPTPTLPSAYAFGEEIQPPESLVLNARQLPNIEPEPVVLDGPRAVMPSKLRRVLDQRGKVRLSWPGKRPHLPWIPRVVRREKQRAPLPKTIDAATDRNEMIRIGFARAVREARDERYLDADQLAEDADMSRWQLTALEEARLTPVPYTLILRIARALEMKPSDLVARGEELEVEL